MANRDSGFNLRFHKEKLPEYKPLQDKNLRHYFENKTVQSRLYSNGLIDANGRVIDLDKNKSKLHIIEQEFKAAEKQEYWRRKEEEEFRRRVQSKRYETLEKIKRAERLSKIKEDRAIRQQILEASRSILSVPPPKSKFAKTKPSSSSKPKKAKRSKKRRPSASNNAAASDSA
eukprot:CAMPEP_0184529748 /NCGR_PEP_ID=MMETSP0198_2-20121128/12563_1 /TAXON_ID=1112570 /ORGANISM="Thraustochytrium sp., Strain LLF1b" /LENGTH=172 /DNA_ID=CAMNT_0026921827 /DNA_START=162 /DNA_END=676 /DNA_ORIENTATION=-